MIHDWLANNGIVLGPASVMVAFFLLFLALLAWLYRPGSSEGYQLEANLPFEDGQHGGPHTTTFQGEGHGPGNR